MTATRSHTFKDEARMIFSLKLTVAFITHNAVQLSVSDGGAVGKLNSVGLYLG